MVELVDTTDLKSVGDYSVWVRVPPLAPYEDNTMNIPEFPQYKQPFDKLSTNQLIILLKVFIFDAGVRKEFEDMELMDKLLEDWKVSIDFYDSERDITLPEDEHFYEVTLRHNETNQVIRGRGDTLQRALYITALRTKMHFWSVGS